jgi:hypothetical protein
VRTEPIEPAVQELAWRLARACRRVVQSCLREEEWVDADREFYAIILMGLARQGDGKTGRASDTSVSSRP